MGWAVAAGLQGVVCVASALKEDPARAVQSCRALGLQLATYGSHNNSAAFVSAQAQAGMAMVILDHMACAKQAKLSQ